MRSWVRISLFDFDGFSNKDDEVLEDKIACSIRRPLVPLGDIPGGLCSLIFFCLFFIAQLNHLPTTRITHQRT